MMQNSFYLRNKYLRKANSFIRAWEETDISQDQIVFVSGIGCGAWISSPHFLADTLHTTHGRAIAFATGVKKANLDLKVVVISGDGDLSTIGGNHLIHTERRNLDLTVICSNNYLYGMTGGQVFATTPYEAKTQTTPEGNSEYPFDLVKLVLGAGGNFVARYPAAYPRKLTSIFKKALLDMKDLALSMLFHGVRKILVNLMLLEMRLKCLNGKGKILFPKVKLRKLLKGRLIRLFMGIG